MKPHQMFYHLGTFALGGSFVYITLGYPTQSIVQLGIGIVAFIVGRLFKVFAK